MQCRCLHLIIVMLNFGLGVRQQQLTRWFIIKPKPVNVLHQPFTILKLLLNNHNQIHRQSTATAQHSDTRFITGGGQDVLDLDLCTSCQYHEDVNADDEYYYERQSCKCSQLTYLSRFKNICYWVI